MSKIWLLEKGTYLQRPEKGQQNWVYYDAIQNKWIPLELNRELEGDWRSQSSTVHGRMLNMKMLVSQQLKRNAFFSFEIKENI